MAEGSGASVQETIDAMNGIEESSQKISQIIGVIDDISFQTNLLALNAGVDLVGKTGAALQQIVESVSEISSLVSAIASWPWSWPDVARLQQIGEDTSVPLALICDSTNAMKDGESPSEQEIGDNIAKLIAEAPHRVAVATFASNVGRVVSIVRAAHKAGRKW